MAKIRINRRKEYRQALRTLIRMTRVLINKLDKFSNKYQRYAFKNYAELGEIPNKYYEDYWKDLYKLLEINARTIIEESSRSIKTSKLLKKAEDEVAQVTYDYITTNTAQNVTYITETTRKQIQSAVAYSVSVGFGQDDTAKQIAKSTAFSSGRSKVIARTETHQAYNYGNYKIAGKLALKKPVKEWLSALDPRTRSWHKSMSGTRISINDSFTVFTPSKNGLSERYMEYTGDPNGGGANVINCRCFTMYYDEDDVIVD
tara:strand:+ start:83 stop:859 length:777 start_codon:yes stop_codon:yes gene_type:complete